MKKLMLHKADSQEQIYDNQRAVDNSYGEEPPAKISRPKLPQGFRDPFASNNNSAVEIASSNQLQLNQNTNNRGFTMPLQQQNNKAPVALPISSGSSTNNNSKIAAGPLSGNEASHKQADNRPIRLNDDDLGSDGPSDTDEDDEEHLDCVHDINGDGEEADVDEVQENDDECDYATEQQVDIDSVDPQIEAVRPLINDMSMDGDIEDADGQDTDRHIQKRPSLFNKLQGVEAQSSVDSDHHFKKKGQGASKQFPLNQMRRRQSGSMGQNLNQIQINTSGDRPANLTNSFQEGEKQITQGRVNGQPGGTKGLFSGQKNKIKLNSKDLHQVNHVRIGIENSQHGQNAAGFTRLNSEHNVVISGAHNAIATQNAEAAMRNSHYQQENSAYTWSNNGMAGANPPVNPPRSRQENDFRRKTLQNFNTRSNKALGTPGTQNQRTVQAGDKMILPLRGDPNQLEHSPYQKDRPQSFAVNQSQPYHQAVSGHSQGNKFSKSSTRKSSNNLNLQQMSFQSNSNVQNSKRVRESHSQSQSPSMVGIGHGNPNSTNQYKNNSGGNQAAIRQFMKGNLKNQQQSQQQTNSGYPAATNSYIGPQHKAANLNRLAFTANNFYDSRNPLGGGVQQYGMRPSADGSQNQQANNNSNGGGSGSGGQAMSRQSRSRQKIMKTNTYGVQAPVAHSPAQQQSQHQNSFGNGVQQQSTNAAAMAQSPYDNALPMVDDFYGQQQQNNMARNTFYVSDDQRQKGNLFKDLNAGKLHQQQQMARGGNHYFAGAGGGAANSNVNGNSGSRQVQRVIWNGPGGQQTSSNQQLANGQDRFTKPRALSRQADAHIKIEVHRDIKIRNYLQNKQTENMNLMFYDFNGSSFGSANNTAQNFYKASDQIEAGQEPVQRQEEVASGFRMNFRAEGDRVPTRERGYRSANQNMRRRDLHKKNIQNLQGGAVNHTMSSVNETVAEHPTEHDMQIPQGL